MTFKKHLGYEPSIRSGERFGLEQQSQSSACGGNCRSGWDPQEQSAEEKQGTLGLRAMASGTKGTERQQLGGQEGLLETKERRTCKRAPVGRVNSSQNPVGREVKLNRAFNHCKVHAALIPNFPFH